MTYLATGWAEWAKHDGVACRAGRYTMVANGGGLPATPPVHVSGNQGR
jgi:hypothetical protein